MKFSKVLETECIPEWRKAYVQYKGLKKLLKNVEKVRKVSEQKAALELAHPMFHDEDDDLDGFHQSGLTCCTQPWSLWRPSTSMSVIRQWTSSRRGDLFIPCSHSVSIENPMAMPVWDEVLLHANDSERQFFALLDRELDKVSVFYNDKEAEAKAKFQSLEVQIKLIADYGQHLLEIGPPLSPYPALFQSRHHRNVPSFVGSASDPHISYSVARNRLKKALTEFYRSLEYLGSYKKLNQLGCQKILKKFDKVSGWKASHIYMDRIKKRHWYSSTVIGKMTDDTEALYINEFADGHRRRGMRKLRVPEKLESYNGTSWRIGLFLGLALSLLFQALSVVADPSTARQLPNAYTNLQIYACFLLPILFSLGFSLDLVVWHRFRINYKFIFELNPRTNMDYHQFAELPASLLLISSAVMYLDFTQWQSQWLPSELCPLVLFIILLGIMLCPFQILYFEARKWLGVVLTRIFLSYCFPVEFRDFFIADELNSLAYSFWTLSYFFCAYSWHWTSLGDRCRFSTSWLTPVLTSLPPWWRLLQCLRRYKDSHEQVHLINGAKYMSSILSTLASGIRRIYGGTWSLYLSFIMSMISSIYTSTWDVKMDWGLVQPRSENWLLRDNLVFNRWVYYVAVPINILLRFAWTLTFAGLPLHSDILNFILAVMEGIRRIQWNIFRLENEHINNCGQFRAIKEIPLPFAILDLDNEGETNAVKSSQKAMSHQYQNSCEDPIYPTLRGRRPSSDCNVQGLMMSPSSPIPMRLGRDTSTRHSYHHDVSFYGRRDFENRDERDEAEIFSSSYHPRHISAQSMPLDGLTRFWSLSEGGHAIDISDTEQDDDFDNSEDDYQ